MRARRTCATQSKRAALQRHKERPVTARSKSDAKRRRSRVRREPEDQDDEEIGDADEQDAAEELGVDVESDGQETMRLPSSYVATGKRPKPQPQVAKVHGFEVRVRPREDDLQLRKASASAKSFLESKRGKKRRSHSMLLARHAPALRF